MNNAGSRWFKVRIGLILLSFAAGMGFVVHKAYTLQVIEGPRFRQMAEEQYLKEIEIPGKRGSITDRNGADLAVSMEVESIFMKPALVDDLKETTRALGKALGMSPSAIAAKYDRKKHFVWVKRRLTAKEAEAVTALNLKGVSSIKEYRRFYPMKNLAAQVIGFTDIDGSGQGGIESFFNHSLKGQAQFANGFRDALGREVYEEGVLADAEFEGHRVELTIDVNVQHVAEVELEKAVKDHGAAGGWAVVMDPNSGEILALANYPTFDPNDPSRYPASARNNQAISNPFEPGSTMKSFVMASALNDRIVKPDDRLDCEGGSWPIGSRVIHDDHPKGVLTVTEVVKYSSNICSAKIGLRMGKERLWTNLRAFGFAEPSGVPLPAETRGILAHWSRWADISTATISFGQGISVSALQLANAFAVIANGGNLLRPRIVRRILSPRGEVVKEFTPEVIRRALDPQPARTAAEILTTVTEAGGTGTQASVEGFSVAGKTGTSQKSEGARGYSIDKRIGLFGGFVPANNPKLVVLVAIDEPKGIKYGGIVAAPAFKAIATAALKNLGVFASVDRPRAPLQPALSEEEIEDQAGDGYVDIAGEPGEVVQADRVPNFIGMPVRRVVETGLRAGVEVEIEGSGRAVAQEPPAGTKYRQGTRCRVVFTRG